VASKQKQFIALVLIMACRKEKQKKTGVWSKCCFGVVAPIVL